MNHINLYNDPSLINFQEPIVVDFETYYDKEYSLKKITTEEYIRCDKFECIGVSIKVGSQPSKFYREEQGLEIIRNLTKMLPRSPFISHNNNFDMGILGLRYNIHPNFMIDTGIMAKLCGLDRVVGGTSLAKLSAFGVEHGFVRQQKGNTVHNMLGVHRDDMTQQQWEEYADYCCGDSDNAYDLYMDMIDKVPVSELIMADITTKMWTKAVIDLDVPLLQDYAVRLDEEREQMLSRISGDLGFTTTEALLKSLRSSKKFVALLESLQVEVPMKWSEKQEKMIPAVSKTDIAFLELLEHDDELVRTLVETKLGTMSNMEQTRTATFLAIASRGRMPIPLRYASAHTGRYGGSDKVNLQNLSKRTKDPVLRRSLRAMQGCVWVAADSSQIENRLACFVANQQDVIDVFLAGKDVYIDMATKIYNESYDDIYEQSKGTNATKEGKMKRNVAKAVVLGCVGENTEVLTRRGWVVIQDVQDDDLLWDGENWVSHGGVVPMGVKDCYNVNTIYLTADHKVYDGNLWKSFDDLNDGDGTQEYGYWWYAVAENWAIANLPSEVVEDWERDGTTGKQWCIPDTNGADFDESWKDACLFEPTQTYDILTVGEHNRFFVRSAYFDVSKPTYLCVHNCGYGASAGKFAELMKQQGLAEQADMADELITTYRTANNMISGFWRECQRVLDVMYAGGSCWFGGVNNDLFFADGSSEFYGKKIPSIRLPNGAYIFYQNLRKEAGDDGRVNYVYDQFKERNWLPKRIWGSAFFENLIQALAFCILKWQAIEIAKTGLSINLNVHDEWASVVPRSKATDAAIIYYQKMKSVPDYIPAGLLDCEVDVGWNYADLKTVDVGRFL